MSQTSLNSTGVASAGSLVLQTNGTTSAVTIDTAQNVGVGVTPSAWASTWKPVQLALTGFVAGRTDAERFYAGSNAYYNGTNWVYISNGKATYYASNLGQHEWYTATTGTAGGTVSFTQAMTLDASGNLGVGNTAPSTTTAGARGIVIGGGGEGQLRIQSTVTGSASSDGLLLSIDSSSNGYLYNYENAALIFGTNNTERARIDSSGNLLVGTTSQGANGCNLTLSTNAGTTKWDVGPRNALATNFYVATSGSTGVYLTSSATAWASNSDERFKTDLLPIENACQKVSTLRSVTGRYITDAEGVSRAFLIAQDVLAVLPEAVDAENPEKLAVQYSDVIPLLVAAIKELKAEIDALKAA